MDVYTAQDYETSAVPNHTPFTQDQTTVICSRINSPKDLIRLRKKVGKGWDTDMQEKLRQRVQDLERALEEKTHEKIVLQAETAELRQELTQKDKQLAGALRVLKERANQDRDIRPKSRSGYILQSFEELSERIVSYDMNEVIPAYRTVLQTCYGAEADIGLDMVKEFVRHDLETKILPQLDLLENCFVDDHFLREPTIVFEKKDGENCIYRFQMRFIPYRGYYEVVIYHTLPIGTVPNDLLPSKQDKPGK